MIDILKILVPVDYQLSAKTFLYYLKTLNNKLYKVQALEISLYQIEILKTDKGLTIVNHQYYTSNVLNVTFSNLEKELKKHFAPQDPKQYEIDFINSLRF
ncbi:hypothetical protein [Flavobacterium sp. TSSA_36]|uniref:hypothetical protein n=1 Tax=Flavobacterium sp. TSSA_36 TaxID=3447669 RepID=UPI003F30F9D8